MSTSLFRKTFENTEVYLITVSVKLKKGTNLHSIFFDIYNSLNETSASICWINRNTCFVKSDGPGRDFYVNIVEGILKRHGTEGDVFAIDTRLAGWTFHGLDLQENEDKVKWIRKYVSEK